MTPAFRSIITCQFALAALVMCLAAALGLGFTEALYGALTTLCAGAGAMLATHYLIGEMAAASEREDEKWQDIDDRHPAQLLRTIEDRLEKLQNEAAMVRQNYEFDHGHTMTDFRSPFAMLAPGLTFVTNDKGKITGVAPLPDWAAGHVPEADRIILGGPVKVVDPDSVRCRAEPNLRNSAED